MPEWKDASSYKKRSELDTGRTAGPPRLPGGAVSDWTRALLEDALRVTKNLDLVGDTPADPELVGALRALRERLQAMSLPVMMQIGDRPVFVGHIPEDDQPDALTPPGPCLCLDEPPVPPLLEVEPDPEAPEDAALRAVDGLVNMRCPQCGEPTPLGRTCLWCGDMAPKAEPVRLDVVATRKAGLTVEAILRVSPEHADRVRELVERGDYRLSPGYSGPNRTLTYLAIEPAPAEPLSTRGFSPKGVTAIAHDLWMASGAPRYIAPEGEPTDYRVAFTEE